MITPAMAARVTYRSPCAVLYRAPAFIFISYISWMARQPLVPVFHWCKMVAYYDVNHRCSVSIANRVDCEMTDQDWLRYIEISPTEAVLKSHIFVFHPLIKLSISIYHYGIPQGHPLWTIVAWCSLKLYHLHLQRRLMIFQYWRRIY